MAYKAKPRWTSKQVIFLRENYKKMTDEQIAEVLGKTLKSVRRKREEMELKKPMGWDIGVPFDSQGKIIRHETTTAGETTVS